MLSAVLRSVSSEHTSATEVVMKLAKRNDLPVLSLEIFGTTQMDRHVKVAHNVRVEVISRRTWHFTWHDCSHPP